MEELVKFTPYKEEIENTENQKNGAVKRKIQTITFKKSQKSKKNLRGFGPLANYADRATAASWRSSTNFCG
jgi:hypothetical protein